MTALWLPPGLARCDDGELRPVYSADCAPSPPRRCLEGPRWQTRRKPVPLYDGWWFRNLDASSKRAFHSREVARRRVQLSEQRAYWADAWWD